MICVLICLLYHAVTWTSPLRSEEIRVATFNTSLFRGKSGELTRELETGKSSHAKAIAEILQIVRPDIVLLNEFDFDSDGKSVACFKEKYLLVSQNKQKPIRYGFHFAPAVNTGIPSRMDLDGDGKNNGPGDAWGFGRHRGQYGFVVLSRFPIDTKLTRTFQKFLWKDMPGAKLPQKKNGTLFYSEKILSAFRLSSKNHCDVVIQLNDKPLHFLVSHPTPPVFDGEEDRNGKRNHDEIRFWCDYVSAEKSGYIYDDRGKRGGLDSGDRFVIAGDLNADPNDGDSTDNPIGLFRKNPLVNFSVQPKSAGAVEASQSGAANQKQKGNPAFDTADFNDETVGNLRIDYVLPSANLRVSSSGVFWPESKKATSRLIQVTDHRLVWIQFESK